MKKQTSASIDLPGHVHFEIGLAHCGRSPEPLPPGYVFGPVTGSSWLLQYIPQGRGVMVADGREFPVEKGDCIATFPGQCREERADREDPWSFIWLAITGSSAGVFFQRMGLTPENPVLSGCGRTKLPMLMEQLVKEAEDTLVRDDYLLGSRIFTFFHACLQLKLRQRPPAPRWDAYTADAVAWLNANYSRQDLTVQELARHLGLNRSYLYELFKVSTGLSPQEYLTRLRIRKGCELLQQPEITAAAAAWAVGYEPSVFSKAFLKIMGVTPGQYRKSYK